MPRRLATVVLSALVATGIGLGATPAAAVVTGTTISTSSYPNAFTLISGDDADADAKAPDLELTGTYTRSGETADGVDSRCYRGSTSTLVGNQSASDNGTFDVDGAAPVGEICDLRAVPAGTTPTSSTVDDYQSLRQAFDYAGTTAGGGASANASTPVHLQAGLPQASALVTLGDAAATGTAPTGGVTTSLLDIALDQSAGDVFDAAGLLPTDGPTTSATQTQSGGIRVDGVNVVTPGAAADIWGTDPTQPLFNGALSVTASIDATTGDATVIADEPLLACPNPTLPASKTSCPLFTPVGVTLTRTVTTSLGGRVVRVTDSFGSQASHAISLDYEHTVASTSTGKLDPGPEFSTDGGSSYQPGVQGISPQLPQAPFSVLVKTSGDPTSFAHPGGSITYSTQPSSAVFANGGDTLVTHYDRQIAAGGSFALTQSYVSSDTTSSIADLSATALSQGLAPSIALTVPASVSTREISIPGIIEPGQNGLPTTVSGPAGTMAPVDQRTGAFSLPAVLQPGSQTLTVTAVDAVGQQAAQTATVSYDDPLSVGHVNYFIVFSSHYVATKKLVGRRLVAVKIRERYVSEVVLLIPMHCSSLATSVCTAKIKISSHGKLLKTVIFTRGPGYRPVVTIPLLTSAYGSAGYDAAHLPRSTRAHPRPKPRRWAIGVMVSYTDPDGTSYPGSTGKTLYI